MIRACIIVLTLVTVLTAVVRAQDGPQVQDKPNAHQEQTERLFFELPLHHPSSPGPNATSSDAATAIYSYTGRKLSSAFPLVSSPTRIPVRPFSSTRVERRTSHTGWLTSPMPSDAIHVRSGLVAAGGTHAGGRRAWGKRAPLP
jgi:hypothetical protein